MRVIDPGHKYFLQHLEHDGGEILTFIKRSGGPIIHEGEYPGTTTQEVIRAAIDRTKYANRLLPCEENLAAIYHLRQALWFLEARAYRRKRQKLARIDAPHQITPVPFDLVGIEDLPICLHCGHVCCEEH